MSLSGGRSSVKGVPDLSMISPIVLELAGLGGRAGVSGGISGTVRSEFAEGGKVKISGSAGGVNM